MKNKLHYFKRFVFIFLLITGTIAILFSSIPNTSPVKQYVQSFWKCPVSPQPIKQLSGLIKVWNRRSHDTRLLLIVNTHKDGLYTLLVQGERSEMSLLFTALEMGSKKAYFAVLPGMEKTHRGVICPEHIRIDL